LAIEEYSNPSIIGPGILAVQHDPARIDAPMIRISYPEGGPDARTDQPGIDQFAEVSWEAANAMATEKLNRVRSTFAHSAIFGES